MRSDAFLSARLSRGGNARPPAFPRLFPNVLALFHVCSALSLVIAKAPCFVIVDQAHRLHEGITDGRAHERETPFFQVPAHGVRLKAMGRNAGGSPGVLYGPVIDETPYVAIEGAEFLLHGEECPAFLIAAAIFRRFLMIPGFARSWAFFFSSYRAMASASNPSKAVESSPSFAVWSPSSDLPGHPPGSIAPRRGLGHRAVGSPTPHRGKQSKGASQPTHISPSSPPKPIVPQTRTFLLMGLASPPPQA